MGIEVKKITERIYLMREKVESGFSNGYVVIGDERALVIDTMYGYESIQEVVRAITDLPLMVIYTHGHCDHIGGSGYFKEGYIDMKDLGVAKEHWKLIQSEREKYNAKFEDEVIWKEFQPGTVIDLGGYTLESYEVPGHTPGGLCFLDRKERILIAGDAIDEHIWMQLEESQPLKVLIQSLKALDPIRDAFDVIWHGHAEHQVPASVIDELIRSAQEILDGKTVEDYDYPCFDKVYKAHRMFPGEDGRVIVYDPMHR